MRWRDIIFACLLTPWATVAGSSLAVASPEQAPKQRLDVLSRRAEQALNSGADVPAVLEGLQQVQAEVVELKRSLSKQQARDRQNDEVRRAIDDLERRLGDLELRMSVILLQRTGRADALPKRGFFIGSVDEKYLLRIGGLLQTGYLGRVFSLPAPYEGTDLGHNRSAFQLRRARLVLQGHLVSPRLRYRLAFAYGVAEEADGLLDAYSELLLHRLINVRLGFMRRYFGRQFDVDAADLLFVDRSAATLTFYPGSELGGMIFGDLLPDSAFGRLSYQLALLNGVLGRAFDDDNTDFRYVARLMYEPLGKLPATETDRAVRRRPVLAVSGSFYYNLVPTDAAERAGLTDPTAIARARDADGDGEIDNIEVYSFAADLTVHFRGFSSQSELFYRHEAPDTPADARTFWGVYSQLGFYHVLGMEAGLRYSYWEEHRFGENSSTVAPRSNHEAAAVLSALLWRDRVKLQLEYAHQWYRDLRGSGAQSRHLRSHQAQAAAQLVF